MGSFRWRELSLHFRLTMGMIAMLVLLFAGALFTLTSLFQTSDVMKDLAEGTPAESVIEEVAAAERAEATATRFVALALGGGVATVLLVSMLLARSIRRPLKELKLGADNFAAGHLSYRIPIKRHDELGEALEMFNSMAAALEGGQEDLEHQAFHDTLTGLPNRSLFHDRLGHALERQTRDHKPLAVLLVDLDDFKTVNDSLGHAAGDELLKFVADSLSSSLRPADTAARLGGDEFAVLVEDVRGRHDALRVADRIISAMHQKLLIEGKEVFVHGSVGIAITHGNESADEVLRNADVAMYAAKSGGKDRYQLFDGAMHEGVMERLDLKADLQRAVERKEFVVHYQPLFDLQSGRIVSAEALVRWEHPVRGVVMPGEFIPLAEETGLILHIGRFVLEEACRQLSLWQMEFDGDLGISVNLSGRQLQESDVVEVVREALAAGPVAGGSLTLELTESVLMKDSEATVSKLNALRALGVHLAIDDFGTGYSSLSYLGQFPIETIKIDRSFTHGVTEGPEDSALARAVIKLADTLGMKSIAEGVETQAQAEQLASFGCRVGQGFLFSPAVPPRGLEDLIARQDLNHNDPTADPVEEDVITL
ncbi:MAG TPA: EAL domain-containing protein [Actinomycetota bacterium]|nr:EAL domain-containing protein [Actinomycetota bacterium]